MLRSTLLAALLMMGCGWFGGTEEPPAGPLVRKAPGGQRERLTELLARPRAELAQLCEDEATIARNQERKHRGGGLSFALLPTLRLPLVIPVLRQAKFKQAVNFSLPPYLNEKSKDNAMALHLARYGDTEAARRLADLSDPETLKRIEELACERNYPVEWTRLVAYLLHNAQVRLASGDIPAVREVIALHQELRDALDPKAARGPLGAALLARGRLVLSLAIPVLEKQDQEELAAAARNELTAWGEVPAPAPVLPNSAPRVKVVRLLGGRNAHRALIIDDTARAFDLLDVPIPDEQIQAVLAFFDMQDRLEEVLVLFPPRYSETYPRPQDLAFYLEEQASGTGARLVNVSGGAEEQSRAEQKSRGKLPHPETSPRSSPALDRLYGLGQMSCEVMIVPHVNAVGAIVRIGKPGGDASQTVLNRDFGAIDFRRSFEQNRLRLAPDQSGFTIRTQNPAALDQITNPLGSARIHDATIYRVREYNLLDGFTLGYGAEEAILPLNEIALPLWAHLGACKFQEGGEDANRHLALVWKDAETRYELRLPTTGGQRVEFDVREARGGNNLAKRAEQAASFDLGERRARLASGSPFLRLPRHLELEKVQLGMTRHQVFAALPTGPSVIRREVPGLLTITYIGPPPKHLPYLARQIFICFDKQQRVVEVRVRYADGLAGSGSGWQTGLLATLKKLYGAPEHSPSPWAALWTDLPSGPPVPVLYLWRDDATLMTCQTDAAGAEVTLRDCPPDHPNGYPLPPIALLPRGPDNCKLGTPRADLLRDWNITMPTIVADGALVLHPADSSRYDALLVWFDKDKVVRLVGRHRQAPPFDASAARLGELLANAVADQVRSLGWPRRSDTFHGALQSVSWNDDVTRVRLFWQESSHGPPRFFTEWKSQ